MKIKTCCWPADWTNAVDCTFLFFNKEPDQSDSFHKRKRWTCWVYRAVLTLLASSSLGMSVYAVYQVTMDENGATGGTPWKAHEVTPDTSYRMWNPVSMSNDGLLLLNPSNGNVHCNGSFSGGGSKFPFVMCLFVLFLPDYLEVKT